MKSIHPKVQAGGLGAALGILVVAALKALGWHPSDAEAQAVSVVSGFIAGYLR